MTIVPAAERCLAPALAGSSRQRHAISAAVKVVAARVVVPVAARGVPAAQAALVGIAAGQVALAVPAAAVVPAAIAAIGGRGSAAVLPVVATSVAVVAISVASRGWAPTVSRCRRTSPAARARRVSPVLRRSHAWAPMACPCRPSRAASASRSVPTPMAWVRMASHGTRSAVPSARPSVRP